MPVHGFASRTVAALTSDMNSVWSRPRAMSLRVIRASSLPAMRVTLAEIRRLRALGQRFQHRVAGTVRDDLAAVENDEAAHQLQHGRLVGGQNQRASLYDFFEMRDEGLLRVVIHGARGLVEQVHLRGGEKG